MTLRQNKSADEFKLIEKFMRCTLLIESIDLLNVCIVRICIINGHANQTEN